MGRRPPLKDGIEALASSISETLFREGTPEDTPEGLYLDDVQLEINDFDADARLLSRLWQRSGRKPVFPMVRQENALVPVALRQLISPHQFLYPDSISLVEELNDAFTDVVPVAIEESRGIFRRLVVLFLTTRIRSVVDFFHDGPTTPVNKSVPEDRVYLSNMRTILGASALAVGFRIDVATKTPNVRIHSSLKIRRNWSYFGFYTGPKPVVGGLLGGIYEFGVERRAGQVIPDPGQFDIPYKTLSPRLLI